MKTTFLVLGYGVPKDIFNDCNYQSYLHSVFKQLLYRSLHRPDEEVAIIFSGGPTDFFKPYRRTEAKEMLRFFKKLCAMSTVKQHTKSWKLFTETSSLSTLENLLNTKKIVQKIGTDRLFVFCEVTRTERVATLVAKVFTLPSHAIPVDFDLSAARYNLDEVRTREKAVLRHDLWALEKPENLEEYHRFYVEKIHFLRKQPASKRAAALKRWRTQKYKNLPT